MRVIAVDSGCDLKELDCKGAEFRRVPLKIIVGDRVFTDDFDLDRREMMDAMAAYPQASRSACPSPEEWLNAFGDADEVYAVAITGGMSGSYASLRAARDIALELDPNRRIFILDSRQASSGMTMLVRKIAAWIDEGKSFEEIGRRAVLYRDKIRLTFVLYSIDNFVKNGRVSRVAGMVSRVLGIHIVCRAEDGNLAPKHKCRGVERGYLKMLDEMELDGYKGGKAVISHSFNAEGAQALKELIEYRFEGAQVEVMPTSGLCCFYSEMNGMLIGYEGA